MEIVFNILLYFEELRYFPLVIILVSFIYLHLPLPITALVFFNSIYLKELAFIINLFLITLSFISVYKIINFFKISNYLNNLLKKKMNIEIMNKIDSKNNFIKVFILRIFIPFPLLNYYLSLRKFELKSSTLASFLSMIPPIYLISSSSKDLIQGNSIYLNTDYLILFLAYTIILVSANYLYNKVNSKKKNAK